MNDHSFVRVVNRVIAQGLQLALGRRLGWWHALHNGLQNILNADAFLGTAREGFFAGNSEDLLDL